MTARDTVDALSCRRKVPYASRAHATTAAREFNAHAKQSAHLRPYHCTHCDQWHLTSMAKQQFRRWRRSVA